MIVHCLNCYVALRAAGFPKREAAMRSRVGQGCVHDYAWDFFEFSRGVQRRLDDVWEGRDITESDLPDSF